MEPEGLQGGDAAHQHQPQRHPHQDGARHEDPRHRLHLLQVPVPLALGQREGKDGARDGKLVAAGCADGSIQMWKHGGLYVNHAHVNRAAHGQAEITSINFSYDSNCLLSRSSTLLSPSHLLIHAHAPIV